MVDYTRVLGTVFCASVSLAQGVFSLDKIISYYDQKRIILETSLLSITEIPDIFYENTLDTVERLSYNPDLYNGIYMGISSLLFAGIAYFYAKTKEND